MGKCLKKVSSLIYSSTFQHLRIPFSFFLLPVFLFALSISIGSVVNPFNTFLAFMIMHLFLYPASNGYNSYFDKDEKSIGGLEIPPPVEKKLYFASLTLDGLALVLGFFISLEFVLMLLIYGLISKAYSHPSVRLKKLPIAGWFSAGFFQGFFTFLMVIVASTGLQIREIFHENYIVPALLSSVLLWGAYPMTQIYQHEEDGKRGDLTISRMLGIKGTFIFSGTIFFMANAGYFCFYFSYYSIWFAFVFQLFLIPLILFFFYWFKKALEDINEVSYKMTMKLNMISACCMNAFFLLSCFAVKYFPFS